MTLNCDSFRPFGMLVAKWNAGDAINREASERATESITHRTELRANELSAKLGLDRHESNQETISLVCRKLNDPDHDICAAVIEYVGLLSHRFRDKAVLKNLAAIVADGNQSIRCRRAAYTSLRNVVGLNIFRHGFSEVRIPKDVDWNLVSTCLKEEVFVVQDDDDRPIEVRLEKMYSSELRHSIDRFQLALEAFNNSNDAEAIIHATACLAIRPDALGARYLRGCANGNLGNLDDAICDLTEVIAAKGHESIYFRERSEMYRRKGLLSHAQSDENTAIQLESGKQ